MEQTTEPMVVGVRFSKVGKIYHFTTADEVGDVKIGDMVVVETSRGWQLGQVAQVLQDAEPPPDGWKPIDRRATPRDLLMRQMWQMKEAEVVSTCRDRAAELHLMGIKITSAEYSFDGSRLTILFSSETEEKYDLKSLRSDMQKVYAPSQVEMRQIGPRDVAKVICGMGACGLETRCCCLFLTEFSSISIRMAKEQGISLTPTEITGMCGRLRCCLIYEYDNYVEARAKLPKRNKRVRTPQGDGKVVDVVPLRGSVIVELPDVGRREFPNDEIQLLDEAGVPQPKPFVGTQQPSAMDQAITGEKDETSFVITPEESPADTGWDAPTRPGAPAEESERTNPPRPERPHPERSERSDRGERYERPNRPQGPRGDRRQPPGNRRPGGPQGQAGGEQEGPAQGGQAPASRGQQPGGREPQPGGRDQQRRRGPGPRPGEGRPGQSDRSGNRPGPGNRQGYRPDRGPHGEERPGPQQGGQAGQQPGPKNEGENKNQPGGSTPRGGRDRNRDQRRRRGKPRDNSGSDNETRS